MCNISLNLPVSESTNNPDIQLPNSSNMSSDDQSDPNTPQSHNNVGDIMKDS